MKLKLIVAAVALSAWTASAHAVFVSNDGDDGVGTGLQNVLDTITQGGDSSVDVNTDQLDDGLDSYWNLSGSGGSVNTFVIEIAGLSGSNTFGIYDQTNIGNYVELFSGADSNSNDAQTTLSIMLDGSIKIDQVDTGKDLGGANFGYYLGRETQDGKNAPIFYSDSSLNTNGSDQMVAYEGTGTDLIQIAGYQAGIWGTNEFILAFEDLLYANSDEDFNDLVVLVESVTPVPEPGTLALLGLGLAGLGAARRRQKA